jgi:hypothetical protein
VYVAIIIERVDLSRADEDAVFWFAFGAAYFLINADVSLFVDLENVLPQFLLHFQAWHSLYLQELKCVFQGWHADVLPEMFQDR